MKLYSFWRSSCSYRLRIALGLKDVVYETVPVNLQQGAQHDPAYAAQNPSQKVPMLELPDGTCLSQSLAILDWLDMRFPNPAFLPMDPVQSCQAKAAAHVIAVDTQPVTNSGTAKMAVSAFGAAQEEITEWMRHWMGKGLQAYSGYLPENQHAFSFGEHPGLADICLIPQLYNARRWGCDLSPFPRLTNIETRCLSLPAFDAARPENQPDAG